MTDSPARRLWTAYEPLHAVVYFAPETAEAAKKAGLRGWWMGYFAGRLAPLGPVAAAPATAMLFGFAPGMVARAVPDCWFFASPEDVLATRLAAVEAALARAVPDGASDELAALLERAAGACRCDGRPLAAAWAAMPRPGGVLGRIWHAATVLREHRGDGHVLAAVHAGLTGLETTLTHVGTGLVGRADVQPRRGWTDADWDAAREALQDKGVLDADGVLTEAGARLRVDIEAETDRLAAAPLRALGEDGLTRLLELAVPLSRAVFDAGLVPQPNPMGVPRP